MKKVMGSLVQKNNHTDNLPNMVLNMALSKIFGPHLVTPAVLSVDGTICGTYFFQKKTGTKCGIHIFNMRGIICVVLFSTIL